MHKEKFYPGIPMYVHYRIMAICFVPACTATVVARFVHDSRHDRIKNHRGSQVAAVVLPAFGHATTNRQSVSGYDRNLAA